MAPRFGLLSYLYISANKLICLAYKGLRKLEAENGGVEPVEIGPAAPGLVNKNIQQLILTAALITEDKLLVALFENELFGRLTHVCPIPQVLSVHRGQHFPFYFFIGRNSEYLSGRIKNSLSEAIISLPAERPQVFYRPIERQSLQIEGDCCGILKVFLEDESLLSAAVKMH